MPLDNAISHHGNDRGAELIHYLHAVGRRLHKGPIVSSRSRRRGRGQLLKCIMLNAFPLWSLCLCFSGLTRLNPQSVPSATAPLSISNIIMTLSMQHVAFALAILIF